jgi:CCR4-NOT transcription complex subunit 2
MCYYNQPPVLKTTHLSKFQLETLFFIFYAMPKDVVQAYAAQELYLREWRYHMDLKLWFKRQNEGQLGTPQYIYFDINTWERRLFGGNSSGVSSGFMGEDETRVKFNAVS